MKTVKQNIIFSISIKVLLMILSIIFTLPMFVAIIGDVGVCLLAILNSLRIIYGKVLIKNV
jgi:Cd2+/Zn2+-exporting ATPase